MSVLLLLLFVKGRLLQRGGGAVERQMLQVELGAASVAVDVEAGPEGMRMKIGGMEVIVGRGAQPTGVLWSTRIGEGSSALHTWMQFRDVDVASGPHCQVMPIESADPMRLCSATEPVQTDQVDLEAVLEPIKVGSETMESMLSTLGCTASCSPYRISVVPSSSVLTPVLLEMDTGFLLRFLLLFLSILGSIAQSRPAFVPASPGFVKAMHAYEQYNHHGQWYVTRIGDRQPPLGDVCFPLDRSQSQARKKPVRQVLPDCVKLSLDAFLERVQTMGGDASEHIIEIGHAAIKKAYRMRPPDDSAVLLYDLSKYRLENEIQYLTQLKEEGLPVIEFSSTIIKLNHGYAYAARYIPDAILVKVLALALDDVDYHEYLEETMKRAARLGSMQREVLARDLITVIVFVRANTIRDLQGLIDPHTGRFFLTDPLGIEMGIPIDYRERHILMNLRNRIRHH